MNRQKQTRFVLYIDDFPPARNNLKLMLENKSKNNSKIEIIFHSAESFPKGMEMIDNWNEGKGYHAVIVDKILYENICEYTLLSPILLMHAYKKENHCNLFLVSGQPADVGPMDSLSRQIYTTTETLMPRSVIKMQKGPEFEDKLFEVLTGIQYRG